MSVPTASAALNLEINELKKGKARSAMQGTVMMSLVGILLIAVIMLFVLFKRVGRVNTALETQISGLSTDVDDLVEGVDELTTSQEKVVATNRRLADTVRQRGFNHNNRQEV